MSFLALPWRVRLDDLGFFATPWRVWLFDV